ncbi:orotidine-5'-phosphate decarboxylase [Peptoniphilus lacrimalis]|uniref:orotidine-5'-phosphate decarboxylase n=1 Tax=Peptoniphilus lacrimalis TaxID=33031 RepID=UPI0023FA3F1B|nr:orotidine-5'-phosphate decarboxylase [Peptoniphilus lacrimalis]MDK7722123.1 orotidine-5'-phosphate decarboxylase [Peptoniphilus lacrimalis]MDK7731631.1 orotidine-5'-phosphate decarboxylase [Peptoniphilus lacrimalis]MDK8282511.1 orotidine-5'-phosphate decarboxylase [Peptoniphilus lacrimalis]
MKDLIIAMDFPSKEKADEFLVNFKGQKLFLKIGMELFYKEGPQIVKEYKKLGHKIFLDLKLHDIPNTVKSATKSLIDLDVDMINFHISGGFNMLKEANEVIINSNKNIIALGVTMLTSNDENIMHKEIKIDNNLSLNDVILSYANLAKNAGLQGIVCSALEVPKIKENLGDNFVTVTPGIRPKSSQSDDQKRVVSPSDARNLGSDYIVVGRPITKSENPLDAYRKIKKEFLGE